MDASFKIFNDYFTFFEVMNIVQCSDFLWKRDRLSSAACDVVAFGSSLSWPSAMVKILWGKEGGERKECRQQRETISPSASSSLGKPSNQLHTLPLCSVCVTITYSVHKTQWSSPLSPFLHWSFRCDEGRDSLASALLFEDGISIPTFNLSDDRALKSGDSINPVSIIPGVII